MAGAENGLVVETSGASSPPGNAGDSGGLARGGSDDRGGLGHDRGGAGVVSLRAGGRIAGIVPASIEEVFRLAKAIALSGMAPKDMGTPEKLTVAILHGLEIGIPPMMAINKIAVVNGRPTLWGDAIPAMLWAKGFKIRETWYGEGDDRFASCSVIRPGGEQITRQFSVSDARVAGLWGKPGPWKQYPDRMLQMRARGLAARDGAPDVLSGIYLAEEAHDIEQQSPVNDLLPAAPMSTRRKSSSQAKKDGDDVAMNELRGAISGVESLDDLDALTVKQADLLETLPHGWARIVEAELADKREELTAQQAES